MTWSRIPVLLIIFVVFFSISESFGKRLVKGENNGKSLGSDVAERTNENAEKMFEEKAARGRQIESRGDEVEDSGLDNAKLIAEENSRSVLEAFKEMAQAQEQYGKEDIPQPVRKSIPKISKNPNKKIRVY